MSDKDDDGMWEANRVDDDVHVTLYYPRTKGHASAVQVEISEVRANDGLRLTYDFERDGWSVQQPRFGPGEFGPRSVETWHEVYFAQAWALETPE